MSADEGGARPEKSCELEIVFVDLDASAAALDAAEEDEPRLSPGDKARSQALAGERQWHWRAARIATRIVLERAAGPHWRKLDFELASGGRPALAGAPHFNVSHSGGAALIAVASLPVGVDLEERRDLAMTADRQRRIVAAAGRLNGAVRCFGDTDADVLEAWVRLEAVAKALGSGIGQLLTDEGVIGGVTAAGGGTEASRLHVRALDVPHGFVAAVAAAALPETIEVGVFPSDREGVADYLDAAQRFSPRR